MIDHLFYFDNEAAAKADPLMQAKAIDSEGNWRGDIVILSRGYKGSGMPRAYEPGLYLWVMLDGIDSELVPTALVVADRAAAARGEEFMVHRSAMALDGLLLEPVPSGAKYPFIEV
jgi:hypothetical protein